MSYYLTVSGHKDTSGTEESKAFEEEILAKAKDFVATLEGVTAATLQTGTLGSVNLQEE